MTPLPPPRDTAGVTTRLIVTYVRGLHGEPGVRRLLELAGETRPSSLLEDERSWSTYEQKVALFEAAEEITGDRWVCHRIGESVLGDQVSPVLRWLISTLGSPQQVLRSCARANVKFSTNSTMEALHSRRGRAVVTYRVDAGYTPNRHDCRYTQGIITQAPVLFGLPPAVIDHPRCQVEGAPACVYEVTWQTRVGRFGPRGRRGGVDRRDAELQVLRGQMDDLQRTVADLVSASDLDEVLGRIAGRATAAVRGQRYLLAVRLGDDQPPRIRSEGLPASEARRLGNALLAGGDGSLPGAEHLVTEVATARHRYGWLAAYLPEGKGFLPAEGEQLAAYGRLAGAALDAATALAEARRGGATARALLQLASDLANLQDTWSIADRVTRAAPTIVGAARASLFAWDEDAQRLVVVALEGYGSDEPAARALEIPRGATPLLDELMDDLQPRVVSQPQDPLIRAAMERVGDARVALVPLVTHGRFLGAVMVSWGEEDAPPEDMAAVLWALNGLANQTAVAMSSVELLRTARHQARHDTLTGLANRLLLQERLEWELADLRRTGVPLAVCFLDLDHFKAVNDALGHAAGDEVLIEVGRRLRDRVRATDAIARVSGDEFVILLRSLDDREGVHQVARDVVESLGRPYLAGGDEVVLGVSVGVAVAPAHGDDPDTLLRAADLAMYAAKRERGTYRVYEPGMGVLQAGDDAPPEQFR